jgi:hypothetical protein
MSGACLDPCVIRITYWSWDFLSEAPALTAQIPCPRLSNPSGGTMKKLSLLTVAAAATTMAFAATSAQAAVTQTLSAKITGGSKAGTKKKPKSIGLTVTTGTVSPNGDADPAVPVQSATIVLPKGININYKKFPSCTDLTALNCPSNTVLGKGTAKAHLDTVAFDPDGQLIQYQGAGGKLLIRTMFQQPAVIDQPVIGSLSKSGGAFVLKFTVPPTLQTPLQGENAQVLSFAPTFNKKTITVKKKKINYMETTSCPKGGWVFKGTFTYLNNMSPPTVVSSKPIACKAGK